MRTNARNTSEVTLLLRDIDRPMALGYDLDRAALTPARKLGTRTGGDSKETHKKLAHG